MDALIPRLSSHISTHISTYRFTHDFPITLTHFLRSERAKTNHKLTEIIMSFQIVAKSISAILQSLGLTDRNKEVSALLHFANRVFIDNLSSCASIGLLVSSANKNVVEIDKQNLGPFIVTFSPLDNIANVTCGLSVGSTFSVLVKSNQDIPNREDAIKPSNKMVAAGYILYGSSTFMILSLGLGVHEFVLDPETGEFYLKEEEVKIPRKGHVYSANEAYSSFWSDIVKDYIKHRKQPENRKHYVLRYAGSLVADVHLILKSGGIFMYPGWKDYPNGKHILLCESKPLAFIITQAGGLAIDGNEPLLDLQVSDIHQKSPIFMGSRFDVEELLALTGETKYGLHNTPKTSKRRSEVAIKHSSSRT